MPKPRQSLLILIDASLSPGLSRYMFLGGPLASLVLREPVRKPGSASANFYYRLHPEALFEVPPALVPGTNIPHEEMGGTLEPDALDRITTQIHGLAFGEGL